MSLGLPLIEWPEVDQEMWGRLVQQGGPLDERGVLADLRPDSLDGLQRRYGRWLGWLASSEPEALAAPPASRATPKRLQAWLGTLAHLSPTSRLDFVLRTLRILRAADPEADWRPQKRLEAHLRRAAGRGDPERKRGRILSSAVLLEAGLRYAGIDADAASAHLEAAKRRRDGLMVAMLAVMPMRRRAFENLAIGSSLHVTPDEIVVSLPEELTKTGVAWEAAVPDPVAPVLRRYIDEVRPFLMAQRGLRHDILWVNDRGRPYGDTYLGQKIATVTTRLTGVRIPPHFFRDAAATTLARLSPRAAELIRPVLAHSDFRTAQRHYNHATALDAGRDYAAVIARLKREER